MESCVTTKRSGESLCVLLWKDPQGCNVKWIKQHYICHVFVFLKNPEDIYSDFLVYICVEKKKKEEGVGNMWMESGAWGTIFTVCLFNLKKFERRDCTIYSNFTIFLNNIKIIHYTCQCEHFTYGYPQGYLVVTTLSKSSSVQVHTW